MDLEILPLKSLDSLLEWQGSGDVKEILDNLPILKTRTCDNSSFHQLSAKDTFKSLICHDMNNGYLDDRFCNGSVQDDSYRFYNWNSIDSFVYFSHHFVTIPPSVWVAAAHIHGVKIFGTLITEWDHGKEIWLKILEDENCFEKVIKQMVKIASTYKFDGWLLNVENEIELEKVPLLIKFVKELTKQSHQSNENSEIIWYDSVTHEGKLDWQNELNCQNRCFFDVCDAIFLNYSWTDKNLCNSKIAAKERLHDVYIGVDVFGRNFFEGGGYNTYKALELIRKYDFSVAMFAQAWTYELFGKVNFFHNENTLWKSLYPFMKSYGVKSIPIATSFCQGFGKNYYEEGRIVEAGSWYNLSKQNIQPLWSDIIESRIPFTIKTEESFNGGTCLSFWFDKKSKIRLLATEIPQSESLVFKFVYKWSGSLKNLGLSLRTSSKEGNEKPFYLICEGENESFGSEENLLIPSSSLKKDFWHVRLFILSRDTSRTIHGIELCAEGPVTFELGFLEVKEFYL